AFFEEGGDAFLAFGGDAEAGDEVGVGGVDGDRAGGVGDVADQGLGRGRGDRAGLQQQVHLALYGGVQRVRLHHLVQQADAVRLGGVEDLCAGEVAARVAAADGGDDVGRDHRRQQAEAAFGEPELRRGDADRDVAGGDQADAAAERGAVDAGDG